MNFNYLQLNIFFFTVYFFALSAKDIPGSDILLAFAGLGSLFIATPLAFFQIFKIPSFSIVEKYFAYLTFYFFLYTPLFFFLNHFTGVALSIENMLITNLAVFAAALLVTRLKPGDTITIQTIQIFNKRQSIVFIALLGFTLLHVLNYYFYHFMPEWDGYTDLIKIERAIEDQSVAQGYRGFFYTSVGLLSTFSGISPYAIFTLIVITLQSSLILVLFQFIRLFNIKDQTIQASLYALALSVPVINMEIDMTRPQNAVIIFLPIFIYFVFRLSIERNTPFLLLASAIALGGMNYHEFFIFPLFVYAGWLGIIFIRRACSDHESQEQRIIAGLTLACFGLIGLLALREIGALQGVILTLRSIVSHISDVSAWRLWFIGSYASDGTDLPMGWPGIAGAFKYYSYYLSPALLVMVVALFTLSIRKPSIINDPLIRILFPLFSVLFVFAEILPRLNHVYLPERFWLLIDILLILSAVPVLKHVTEQFHRSSRIFLFLLIGFSLIGIAGSLYVASNKKALTSRDEYQAALWIRDQTPENSAFITQSANIPMIRFFAKRAAIAANPEYFLSTELLEQDPALEIDRLNQYIKKRNDRIESLVDKYANNRISFFKFADEIQKEKLRIKKAEAERRSYRSLVNQSKYIVYSFDKFDTMYREREWWLLANASGANLEKFNQAYRIVYNKGGVHIWQVR